MSTSDTVFVRRRPAVDGGLKSVVTALDMLDCFRDVEQLGVTELATRLGIAKSTAHRLLTSLVDRGFVQRDPRTGRYLLGLRLFELGQLAAGRLGLREQALPVLQDLRQRTGCTIHLAVPAPNGNVVYIERLHGPGRVAAMASVGYGFPAHLTSSGKVIAAFDPAFAEVRRKAGFPTRTTSSIRDVAAFDSALEGVRRLGLAVNDQELLCGLTTVGAPVRDQQGRVHAAISLVATTTEVRARVDGLGRLAIAAAKQLSRDIHI